jgi:hypothetical protein
MDGGEQSASNPRPFAPKETDPTSHWIAGCPQPVWTLLIRVNFLLLSRIVPDSLRSSLTPIRVIEYAVRDQMTSADTALRTSLLASDHVTLLVLCGVSR